MGLPLLADAVSWRDLENTRHWTTGGDTVICVLGQCGHVMRNDDPPLNRGPFENGRIVSAREADVLNADNIDVGVAAEQSSYDVAVEVLVCGKSQH